MVENNLEEMSLIDHLTELRKDYYGVLFIF